MKFDRERFESHTDRRESKLRDKERGEARKVKNSRMQEVHMVKKGPMEFRRAQFGN